MYKEALEHRLTRHKKDWKCTLCNYEMKQCRFADVKEHMMSDEHLERLNKIDEAQRKQESNELLCLDKTQRKRLVRSQITLDERFLVTHCHICNLKITGLSNALKHVVSASHAQNMTKFSIQNKTGYEQKARKISYNNNATDEIVGDKNITAQSSIYFYKSGLDDISHTKHTDSHHTNICKTTTIPEMFKKCLENRITRIDQDYKCHLCQYVVKQGNFDAVEEHLQTEKHKKKINEIDEEQRKKESEGLLKFSEQQRKQMVENLIVIEKHRFFMLCRVCKCTISGLANTLLHIRGALHKKEWTSYVEHNNQIIAQRTKKVSCDKLTLFAVAAEESINVQAAVSVCQSEMNKIIYDENSNSHYCNICKTKIIANPNIMQHIQGLLHQALEAKLKNSSIGSKSKIDIITYDEKCNSYYCNICKHKIVSDPNIDQHVQGFLHQTMLEARKASQTKKVKFTTPEFSNGIVSETDHGKTKKVNFTVPEFSSKVFSETEDGKAKKVHFTVPEFSNKIVFGTEDALILKKVNNSSQEMDLQKKNLESCFTEVSTCHLCHVFLDNSAIVQYHLMLHLIKEFELLNEFDILQCQFTTNEVVYLKCTLCNYSKASNMLVAHEFLDKHFKTKVHLERLQFFKFVKKEPEIEDKDEQLDSLDLKSLTYISPSLMCNVCEVPIPFKKQNVDEHVLGKSHKTRLTNTGNSKIIETKNLFDVNDRRYYKCFMCDKSFSDALNLLDHYKSGEHKWKMKALNMIEKCSYTNFDLLPNKKIRVRCTLCKKSLQNYTFVIDHVSAKKHIENLALISTNQESQNNNTSVVQVTSKIEQLSLNPIKLVQKQENMAVSAETQNFSVITTKSLKKIKKASNLEASVEELNKLGFSEENIQPLSALKPDMIANVLGDLVSLNFSDSQTKRLPSLAKTKSPRTPKVQNQGNSFATNVLLNGKHYIKFCIDPGLDNIYNFDNEKITILQLGVSLTYPYQAKRICLPCGQEFPDDVQSLFEHLQNQEHLNNIYQMQVDDKQFENLPDQFSDLRLGKLYMQDVADEFVECHCCNVKVGNEDETIRQHADTLIHKQKSTLWREESEQLFSQYLTIYKDIWYHAEVFFCEICKKKFEFEIDFGMHLIHPEHMKKAYELKCKGVALTYDLCPSCITYWCGKTDSYELHCKSNFHKRFARNKDFMVPNLIKNASEFLDNIDKNADSLESESDKVNMEKDNKENALLQAVLETVKPKYPDAQAYIFGSRLSHLGFPDSDVDVFLDCENVYYTSSTQEQSQQYIKSIKNYFDDTPNTWVVDEVLLATRVPIMKLRHVPTNLKCDISFISGLSVEKSRLVGLYNTAFPICRKLILFMKKWLKLCRIFGSDYITTFAISWCVIFYLQVQGIIPSVHELINRKKESKMVDGWQCGYDDTFSAKSSNLSFKEHLKEFFIYFANFDYQKNVICPYFGKPIDKNVFAYENIQQLPTGMDIYKKRLQKKEIEIFRFDSPMCIQDPIDLSQNMTKAVKKQQLRCFRQYCILSSEKCEC